MAAPYFWEALRVKSVQPDQADSGFWVRLSELIELANYRPEVDPQVQAYQLTGRQGVYYVLKNPSASTYYQLDQKDHFLWEMMDGKRSVKDLVVEYFLQFQTFAFPRVARLVQNLKYHRMLMDQPVSIFTQVQRGLQQKGLNYRLSQFSGAFMQKEFAIKSMDRIFGALYRLGGKLLFTLPLQIIFVLISLVGVFFFMQAFNQGLFSFNVTLNGSASLGILTLLGVLLVTVLIHELSHALTVKHFGCEVRQAGMMIYFGMPGFFVDTTDIWTRGKKARIAVTWAGPYSGLILSGIAAIIFTFSPNYELNTILYRFAFMSYMIVFLNVNPLLKLDGYYLLMDWLEIPRLREKSFAFLQHDLPAKIRGVRKKLSLRNRSFDRNILPHFSREEIIFLIFGFLSAVWTGYAVFMGIRFWESTFEGAISSVFSSGGNLNRIIINSILLGISAIFLSMISIYPIKMIGSSYKKAAQRGTFANTWRAAGILVALSGLIIILVEHYGSMLSQVILGEFILATGILFCILAWRGLQGARIARIFPFFIAGGIALIGYQLSFSHGVLFQWTGIIPAITISRALLFGSCLCFLIPVVFLFFDQVFKGLKLFEWITIGVGIGLIMVLMIYYVNTPQFLSGQLNWLDLEIMILPFLCVLLLIPLINTYLRTIFAPAWVSLVITLFMIPLTYRLQDLFLLLPFAFFCSMILYWIGYSNISYAGMKREIPESLNDRLRLSDSVRWMIYLLINQHAQLVGRRNTNEVVLKFNQFSESTGWGIEIVNDAVVVNPLEEISILKMGERYANALHSLIQLCRNGIGEKVTTRSLQNGYDSLAWREREIASQYCFQYIQQSEHFGQEFQSAQGVHFNLLKRMPLFATMSDSEIRSLASCLKIEKFKAGRLIIQQGERGDRFYIVTDGYVEVTQRDEDGITHVVNKLYRGDYFGELALLGDTQRNATCKAVIPTQTLTMSKQDFDQLISDRFTIQQKVDQSIQQAALLRSIPLFSEMDSVQIEHIGSKLEERHFEQGDFLIQQGEIGDTFYIIESGKVKVFISDDQGETTVAERGPGEYIGEIALLMDVQRTASVQAMTPVDAFVLYKVDFDDLVKNQLLLSRGLEREYTRRMIDLRSLSDT